MKKPVLSIDEPEQKKAPRADRPPTKGFVVVVDGHFKSEFMLQIEIYDARHHWERKMALLKRELHRQVRGPEITHADRCTLVFDTDTKRLYVENEVAHFEAKIGGTVEYQTTTMDIADYLTQGGQTAGHRELWRLLRSLFNENSDSAEYIDETSPAGG